MSGIIYVTRCLVNGKLYVGLHTKGRKNYLGSGKVFLAAVKKHGRKNFLRTDLDTFLFIEDGQMKERAWIAALNSKMPNGYNLTDGGEGTAGWRASAAIKAKMSASHLGKKRSPESVAKFSAYLRGNARWLGRHHSAETKAKMSASAMGNKRGIGNKSRTGQPSWNKGGSHSAKTKMQMSISALRRWDKQRAETLTGEL